MDRFYRVDGQAVRRFGPNISFLWHFYRVAERIEARCKIRDGLAGVSRRTHFVLEALKIALGSSRRENSRCGTRAREKKD
jgi:hypothetical protein